MNESCIPPNAWQESDDIAEVIMRSLNDSEPRLRIATSEYGEEFMKVAFDAGIGDTVAMQWYDKISHILEC